MDEADGEVDARLSKARINFEVAPNPDDVALTGAWNDLSESKRHQLSVSIATDITNRAMRLFGVTGTIKEQQGGFEEETNTSFQLILDQPEKTGEIQNFIGYVLSQKSMVAVSEESFPGSEKTGVVTVSIGNADPQAIYRQLRGIKVDGNQPVSGHSTAAGKMAILNYSDVSTEEIARLIDSELRGKFDLHIDEVYTSFPEAEKTEDYGYGNNRQAREAAAGRPPLQRDADNLRRTATELIRKELKLSPARYEQPATDGGVAGQDRPGDRRLGRVSVTGTHYSREQREHLSGVFFGTGLNAEEGKRIQEAKDQRLKSRLYAYVNEGQGVFPEAGVGAYAHTVKLDNLYDLKADPLGIRQKTQDANDRESLILDSGFDGYYAPGIFGRQGVAILMGGAATRGVTPTNTVAPAVSASEAQKPARRTDLPLGQMTGAEWKKLEPRKNLEVAASIMGYVLNQEGVYWHYPIYRAPDNHAMYPTGVEVNFGRSLTTAEVSEFYGIVSRLAGHQDWAPANTPTGVRFLNFTSFNDDPAQQFDHKQFEKLIERAAGRLKPWANGWTMRSFTFDGDAIENNWKENPNGEDYRSRVGKAGRSDLLKWADDQLSPAIDRVNKRYADQYRWGPASRAERLEEQSKEAGLTGFPTRFSPARSDAAGNERAGGRAAGDAQALPGYGSATPGSVSAQGFHYSGQVRKSLDRCCHGTGGCGRKA